MATDCKFNRIFEPHCRSLLILAMASVLLSACGSSDVLVKGPYMRGVDHYDMGEYPQAISEYQEALSDNPEDHRVHYNLGLCFHDMYLDSKGKEGADALFDKAQAAYRKAQSLTENKARAQVAEAKLVWDSGDHDVAITMLSAINGDDGSGQAMPAWTRGTMLLADGRGEEATAAFEDSLAADENYLPAITALADLHTRAGRLDEAGVLVEKGLKKSPHDVTLLMFSACIAQQRAKLANSQEKENHWRECLLRWRLAEALVPSDWEVLYGIAVCAEALGQNQLAVRYLWFARDNASDAAVSRRGHNPALLRADIKKRLIELYPQLAAGE